MLERGLETKFLAVFASIEFNLRSIVASVKSGMFSRAESVEFINEVLFIVAKSTEDQREFTFVFLQIHKSSKERRDQVV